MRGCGPSGNACVKIHAVYVLVLVAYFAQVSQPGNAQSVRNLMKINADLARLGNLFKLALDEGTDLELEELMGMIAQTQVLLKSKVMEL